MLRKLPARERTADGLLGEFFAFLPQNSGTIFQTPICKWDVVGDHHVALSGAFGDPIVGNIGTLSNDDAFDELVFGCLQILIQCWQNVMGPCLLGIVP